MSSTDCPTRAHTFELWLTAAESERAILQRLSQFAAELTNVPASRRPSAMKPHVRLASFECDTRHPNLDFCGQFKAQVWAQYVGITHSASTRDALVIKLNPSEDLRLLFSNILIKLQELRCVVSYDSAVQFPPLQLFPITDLTGRQDLQSFLDAQGRLQQLTNGTQTQARIKDPETNTTLDGFTGGYLELWSVDGTTMTRSHKWKLGPERSWRPHLPPFLRHSAKV